MTTKMICENTKKCKNSSCEHIKSHNFIGRDCNIGTCSEAYDIRCVPVEEIIKEG